MSWEKSPNLGEAECEREGCTSRVFLYYPLCPKHFFALPKDAQIELGKDIVEHPCTAEGCGQEPIARGLCPKHYQALRRTQAGATPRGSKESEQKECMWGECDRPTVAKGYCTKHYQQYRRGTLGQGTAQAEKKLCYLPACEELAKVKGLCPRHYQRVLRASL